MSQVKSYIRRDDIVVAIAGRDRGKRGKVLRVFPAEGTALVEGINFIVKATKPDPKISQTGGFVKKEAPIKISNFLLFCSNCQKPVRIRKEVSETGKKQRICRKCNQPIGKG